MYQLINPELSSPEETRCQFNRSEAIIKLGIDVHEEFCVVVEQVAGLIPSRHSVSTKKRFCTGQPRSRTRGTKCTPSMKGAGLVLDCSERSARRESSATMNATGV